MAHVFLIGRKAAATRLTARWNEQARKFPRFRDVVPLRLYIARNLHVVRVRGLLEDYANP